MQLTSSDFLAIERELCKRSLAEFAKRAWHVLEPATELKWGWALDAICEHLEAVTAGEITRLLMNVPPGSMKSLLTGVIFPAWEWGPRGKPEMRYLGTAHAAHLATRDSTKCRRLIQSPWYQERWPVTLTGDQNAKTKFENDKTGFREAMAFEGMTGSRGDRVLIDDPHSVADGKSAARLETGVQTFREAIPSRVNNDESAIIIIMQRLHERDISQVAIELGYEHLCIPMRYEPARSCVTRTGWSDPRTEDGELMFPERFPEQDVATLETSLGSYATASQLQQAPAPIGGGLFRDEWWRYYTVLPRLQHKAIYADTALKTKEQNDYSVFQCWGQGMDGAAYLIDQIRGKWEAPELLVQARAFYAKHAPVRAMKVEDKASGTGLIQQLQRGSDPIPVLAIQRDTDKVTRAMDAGPQIEAGNVYLPSDAPWLSDYLAEFSAFPRGAHDDQVDPTMDAIADMLSASNYDINALL